MGEYTLKVKKMNLTLRGKDRWRAGCKVTLQK